MKKGAEKKAVPPTACELTLPQAGPPAPLSDERSQRESHRPTTFPSPPSRSPWEASSRCHSPTGEGEGGEHKSPGEAAKMESKLQKASSNNTDSMLPCVFQKTQNKITFPDVHRYICKSTERSSYAMVGKLSGQLHTGRWGTLHREQHDCR